MIQSNLRCRAARRSDASSLRRWFEHQDRWVDAPTNDRHLRRWYRRALKNPDELHFLIESSGEVHAYLRLRAEEDRVSGWLAWANPGGASPGEDQALADLLRQATTQARFTWSRPRLDLHLGSSDVRVHAMLGSIGFDAVSERCFLLETSPLTEEEVKDFKAGAWGTEAAAESYERRVYRRNSGIVAAKNHYEIGCVLRHAKGKILDAGAGSGRFSLPLQAAGHDVVALDISAPMLKIARRHANGDLRCMVADLLHLPFPDGHFDSIVSITVVEHLPQYREALEELIRVLRPGGTLVFQLRSADAAQPRSDALQRGAVGFAVQLTQSELTSLLHDLALESVRVAPYSLLLGNPRLQRVLGRSYPWLEGSLDKLLCLPLAARAVATIERHLVSRMPISTTKIFMVVAKKPM